MQLPFFRKKSPSASTARPSSASCVPRSSFLKKRRGADNSESEPQHKLPVISASGKYLEDQHPSWKIGVYISVGFFCVRCGIFQESNIRFTIHNLQP